MGEFATSFFSALMGVIGSAKSLQALARDDIFPGLSIFGQGTVLHDEPTIGILFTFLLAQLTLFADINTIASFVTKLINAPTAAVHQVKNLSPISDVATPTRKPRT